jgi:hypothetical protein
MSDVEKAKRQQSDTEFYDLEYDLYLNADTNAEQGLMHWYYFKVMTKNCEPGTKIKFNIRNLHRTISLYEQGMLPRMKYAMKDVLPEDEGWHVDPTSCLNVKFFQTKMFENFDPESKRFDRQFYSMSFIYRVKYENE